MSGAGAPPASDTNEPSTLELARELVRAASVTPEDNGCQARLNRHLERLGFEVESLPFGDVTNSWARRSNRSPLLLFAGHTDVVPPGPLAAWTSPPFAGEIREGRLYGRGAADMKGSLAAMVTACRRFVRDHPGHEGSIGFLVTSDEEGPAEDGTARVLDHLRSRGVSIDWCVLGEPSSSRSVGDVIRHGRRGSLNGRLTVRGVQGHVAYPEVASNPIHGACRALAALVAETWDEGDEDFPATSFQVSNLHAGTGAENVIPGELEAWFNLRYSAMLTREEIERRVERILDGHGLDYAVDWHHSGRPFITRGGRLIEAARRAVRVVAGIDAELSTSGGTSDGRFIAPAGAEVVEIGPVNATIHQIDEHVAIADLDLLSRIYERIMIELLVPAPAHG